MALPDFIIIGAQRCGTTSLSRWLARHPNVMTPTHEVSFYDLPRVSPNHHIGSALGKRKPTIQVVGYKSPNYLFNPIVPERLRFGRPNCKLLVLLRNPVDRAYSHWGLMRQLGREKRPFKEAVYAPPHLPYDKDICEGKDHNGYLARGHYADQLERWFEHFPRERFYIIQSEGMFANPHNVYRDALLFLGLSLFKPHFDRHGEVAKRPKLHHATRRKLAKHFEEHNERLYGLLEVDYAWR
jgi:hypothetical protein